MSERDLDPFEAFITSLSEEQYEVFWKELKNPDFYEVMEDHLTKHQYEKMTNADNEIKYRRAEQSNSYIENDLDGSEDDNYRQSSSAAHKAVEQEEEDNTEALQGTLNCLMEKSPKSLKILLLGEAGVGKSTMINSCANYLKYLTYQNAKKPNNSLQIAVEGSFTLFDEEMNSRVFSYEPSPSSEMRRVNISESVIAYSIPIIEGSSEKSITFLDTPGFGSDSDANESEFDDALDYAKSGDYDAVLILLYPNMARLTQMLEIFLSKAIDSCFANRVYFCFTNSQLTMYRFGETFSTLKSFLQKKKPEMVTNLSERSFCFENEAFKYLRVMQAKDFQLDENQIRGLANSWKHSTEAMFKLLQSITPVQKVHTPVFVPSPIVNIQPHPRPSALPSSPSENPIASMPKPSSPVRPTSYIEAVEENISTYEDNHETIDNEWTKGQPATRDMVPPARPKTPPNNVSYTSTPSVEIQSTSLKRREAYNVIQISEIPDDDGSANDDNVKRNYVNRTSLYEREPLPHTPANRPPNDNSSVNRTTGSNQSSSIEGSTLNGRNHKSRSDSYNEALSPLDGVHAQFEDRGLLRPDPNSFGYHSTSITRQRDDRGLPVPRNPIVDTKQSSYTPRTSYSCSYCVHISCCLFTCAWFAFIILVYMLVTKYVISDCIDCKPT